MSLKVYNVIHYRIARVLPSKVLLLCMYCNYPVCVSYLLYIKPVDDPIGQLPPWSFHAQEENVPLF